ncbi:MAG TPA: RluA family pseudouridine synthase [Spirochaetales bacterium]|nr:RluA family pseudouridine synthase [Spirochaetales bacterium]
MQQEHRQPHNRPHNSEHQVAQNRATPHRATQHQSAQNRTRRVEFLYEDRDLIAIEKPAGLAVIAGPGSREKTAYDLVSAHIQHNNPHGRAALVHRLDRDTSGVMIFAKNPRAKKALMDNWNELVKERVYVALIEGEFDADAGTYDTWLAENRAGTVYETEPGAPGSLRAVTHWRRLASSTPRLASFPRYTLLELSLETGRKHQIRAQLAAAHHPVAGDHRYGARTDPFGRLCLHAKLIVVEHPFTHELLKFESKEPEFFWQDMDSRR